MKKRGGVLLILRNGANFLAYTGYPKRSRFASFLRLGNAQCPFKVIFERVVRFMRGPSGSGRFALCREDQRDDQAQKEAK